MALGNARPMFRCDECGQRVTGQATTTATGRRLCQHCADVLDGMTLAVMTGDPQPVGEAIAISRWLTSLRRRRSR